MAEHEITFRQGVAGYSGTVDTQLVQALPTLTSANAATLGVDKGTDVQVLLRFDNLFGGLPPGAQIVSATLTLQTTNAGNGASLHRMLSSWSGSSTWNSTVNGVQADGVEAVATADVVTGATSVGVSQFNVTNSVQSWLAGQANNGWVFLSQGTNGWDFYSAQGTTPPQLTIRYSVPDGPTNAAPVAVTDTISVAEDASVVISVLANDTDANGDALSVTGAGAPAHGTAVINQNGTITYTPTANYAGADSFTYSISDGHGGSATGTVNLTVTPVNDAPVAVNDTAQVNVNSSVIIAVLGNDTDIEGQALGVTGVGTPSHGAVVINGNGTLTYTPAVGYLGPDSFTYAISDGNGGTAIGTVNVSVNATNAIPVANPDTVVLNEDTPTIVAVLGNDTDADGHALSVTAVGTPLHGAVVINQNGTVTFTPTANYSGTDTFSYTISDGHGGTSSASVNLTINPVNDAPVATVDTGAVETGNSVILNVLANDTDVESNPLTVTGVSTPAHGAIVINQNNTITYTPVVGYVGPDTFTYTVSDGNGGTNTASVGITVTAPPPTYVDHSVSFKQGVGGYTGTVDTQVVQGLPTANNANTAVIGV
ncbi:MAG: Ig-like domain-containing protein, partial [Devosia sp.]